MPHQVSATVESYSLPVAAAFLGIRGASRAGIVRSALALFHGHDRADAARYAYSDEKLSSAESGHERIVAKIPDELLVNDRPSWAIRVGLGMAMGLTRAQAEKWAASSIEVGRPRKDAET